MLYVVARKIIKIATSGAGHAALKSVADHYGMKEYIVAGRILDWFASQDDIYQREVLGLLQGLEPQAVSAYMVRIGSPGFKEPVPEVTANHPAIPPVVPPTPNEKDGPKPRKG